MKKAHYGFFTKWKDFYRRPTTMFENLLLEEPEKTATILIPNIILQMALFYLVTIIAYINNPLIGAGFSGFLSIGTYFIIMATYFFFMHAFLRMLKGMGTITDTFTAYGYSTVFITYTMIILGILTVLGLLIKPWVALIPLIILMILQIWSVVSMIIGLSTTHSISAIRTIFAVILTAFAGFIISAIIQLPVLIELINIF